MGCEDEQIRTYRVPRAADVGSAAAEAPGVEQRLLGAIVPHGDRTWFFKLLGPADAVADEAEAFDRFIRSIRFEAGEPAWSIPEGWRQQSGGGTMRFATLRVGPDDQPLELTVIPLPAGSGSLLDNVNRWRGQVGLPPVAADGLDEVVERVEIGGQTATVVDFTGSGGGGGMTPPFASGASDALQPPFAGADAPSPPAPAPPAPSAPASSADQQPIAYETPPGWEPTPGASSMRVASFQIERDGQAADVSVIPLGGAAGGLRANVDRWRGQIGLPPLAEGELEDLTRRIEIDGQPADYVDLIGPDSAGEARQRILAAVAQRGGVSWFFKMIGPADLVGREKEAFEQFVRSVRFNDGG